MVETPAVQATETPAEPKRRRENSRLPLHLMRLVLLLGILLGWELASGPLVAEFFVSRPTAIMAALYGWIADGSLFFHMSITAIEAFLGFLIGGTIGMIVGIVLGRAKFLADLLDPFIMA